MDENGVYRYTEKASGTDSTDGLLNSTNALGDSIARASSMVGMYASVTKTENGVTTSDEGFIASIRIKDGVISAVINDRVYALADITEVTYATVIEDGEQDVIVNNEEETALQMGAIIPDKNAEDIPDLVDDEEEEQIQAVQGIEG